MLISNRSKTKKISSNQRSIFVRQLRLVSRTISEHLTTTTRKTTSKVLFLFSFSHSDLFSRENHRWIFSIRLEHFSTTTKDLDQLENFEEQNVAKRRTNAVTIRSRLERCSIQPDWLFLSLNNSFPNNRSFLIWLTEDLLRFSLKIKTKNKIRTIDFDFLLPSEV